MADVDHEPVGTRKGFSFSRTPRAGVKVRVRVGEKARWVVEAMPAPPYPEGGEIPKGDPRWDMIPQYREVELSAAEWIDVVTSVAAFGQGERREDRWKQATDLHMGPPEGLPHDFPELKPRFMVLVHTVSALEDGLPVEHAEYAAEDDLILATGTGEVMRVKQAGEVVLVVERGVGETASAALATGAELLIIGNVNEET